MKGRLSLDATNRSSPPEVFLRKGISIICCKFTREHPCRSAILIKLQSNFIEMALRHGCSPVNLLHIFRALFLKNASASTSSREGHWDCNSQLIGWHSVKSVQIRSSFWSVFSCIRTEYGDLRSNSKYSVRIQKNTDHK